MPLGLYLMTEKGLRVLEAILCHFGPKGIAWVCGSRDTGVTNDYFDAIEAACRESQVRFYTRGEAIAVDADHIIAVSWRWLIPSTGRLIVLHDSLLPKYRGFAPLPTALINGETRIGVTALLASEEYDRGPIVGQKSVDIRYPIKIRDAIGAVSELYAALVIEVAAAALAGNPITGAEQDEQQATYSLWRDEEDYRICWEDDALVIRRFVDSLGEPYRGASSLLNGTKVRIMECDTEQDVRVEQRQPGKVIFMRNGCPVVVCGQGLLKITDLRDDQTRESLLPLTRFRSRFR